MKLTALFLVSALAASAALAQTAPHAATAPAKRTAVPSKTVPCAKLPDLSPKIPALPAGLPCAKPLYTITTTPAARLDYVSPLENPALRENLGLEPTSFSLDYIDTKIGTGELAAPHKTYTIHYTGYLVDGTKFDSSIDTGKPITVAYGQHQVIPGWDTGFDGMHVGGKRRLFIPYQLAYGATAHGPIPAKSELIFDVELISMSDTPPPPPMPAAARPVATPPQPGAASRPMPMPTRPAARTPDGTIPAPPTPPAAQTPSPANPPTP